MGKSSGAKKTTTSSTQTTTAPNYLADRVRNGVADATTLYSQGAPAYFSGESVAGFTPAQLQAQQGTIDLATAGSPLVKAAQGQIGNILNQGWGADNPTLQAYIANVSNTAVNNANAAANAGGRFGSGANAATAATAVTNAALPIQLQQYNADRSAAMSAATLAPTLANYDFDDLSRIYQAGSQQQEQNQNVDNANYAKWQYDSTEPENWLDHYLSQLNGSAANNWTTQTGTQTTSQSGGKGSILGIAAGLGLTGASAYLSGGASLGLPGLGSAIKSGLGLSSPSIFGAAGQGLNGLGLSLASQGLASQGQLYR